MKKIIIALCLVSTALIFTNIFTFIKINDYKKGAMITNNSVILLTDYINKCDSTRADNCNTLADCILDLNDRVTNLEKRK